MGFSTIKEFYTKYYSHYQLLWEYLTSVNIIGKPVKCTRCGNDAILNEDTLQYRCRKTYVINGQKVKCAFKRSARRGTFFGDSKLTITAIIEFVTLWLLVPFPRTKFIKRETKFSSQAITDWSSFCREVCVDWAMNNSTKIGGPGHVVEIDEAKFGKRKYNTGSRIQGRWVFGGIDRETKECFLIPVEDKSKETLLAVIKTHIKDGTTIISDRWKSYDCLQNEGFQRHSIKHSIQFLDPSDTSVHTSEVGRLWRAVRGGIPRYGRKDAHLVGYLAEFLFKAKNEDHLVHQFLLAAANLYPNTV